MSVRKNGFSIGMLLNLQVFPNSEMPDWANTAAKNMSNMGMTVTQIKRSLEAMEIERRRKVRESLGTHVPITEFDEYLADMLNRFTVPRAG